MAYFEYPPIYTGEAEPKGAKKWIPLTHNGVLIKSNVKKCLAGKPIELWVYDRTALVHLAEFDWPWTKLKLAEDAGPAIGRWKSVDRFRPGIDDL